MRPNLLVFAVLFLFAKSASADLPLTIEDLTADKNRFKLNTSLSYYNQNDSSVYKDDNHTLLYGESNIDNVAADIGLKYGVTNKLDIGASISGYYTNQRNSSSLGDTKSMTDTQFQGINLSSQYQLTSQHKTLPDSLIFIDVSAYDRSPWLEPDSLSSVSIGSSLYKINDPIALSVNASYQYNAKRNLKGSRVQIDIGDVVNVSGSVGFAVNPDITLTSGVSWQSKQPDRFIDLNKPLGHRHTQTNLNFGMAYAVSERSNLIANVGSSISGESGSVFSMGLTTKLGELPPPPSQKYRQNLQRHGSSDQ